MTRFAFLTVILSIASSLTALQAPALEVSYTFNKTAAQTTWNVPTTSLQYFDSSLGTLTSVKIEMDMQFNFSGTIRNDGPTTDDFYIVPNARMALTKTQQSLPPIFTPNWINIQADTDPVSVLGLAPNATVGWSSPTYNNSGTITYTGASDLAAFTGTGQLPTYLKAGSQTAVYGDNAYTVNVVSLASGFAKVTYTYTPVPEPSTYAMAGVAIMTLGYVGRRNRRRSKTVG